MYKQVTGKEDFSKIDLEVLEYWEKRDVFKKTLKKNSGKSPFVFFEGPPTANAKPHIGHVLPRAFKDLFPRYKTMKGYYCLRKSGWDTHGLPVELEVEKELKFTSRDQIENFGVEKFNALCKESVFKYVSVWEKLTKRIGFWLDMENPYITLDKGYIESLWSILKRFWDANLLYKDYKVLPYCPRCQTSLSSHELAQGYKDVTEVSVYVKFPFKGQNNKYLLAWTTTPWTLPGNVALAIDSGADYVEVELDGETFILAKKLAKSVVPAAKIVRKLKGKELVGLEYDPVFDLVKYEHKAYFVVEADFISMEEGTGIVHTAVMYGVDDFELGNKLGLPKKHSVGPDGKFVEGMGFLSGIFVKKADPLILEDLKSRNLLFKTLEITHSYPFCWRCKTPLLYYALESFFIKTSHMKDKIISENQSIDWHPKHLKKGRMGEWLNNMVDWAVSRSRYWGTPLPVWVCDGCGSSECFGSFEGLSLASVEKIEASSFDPHRPYIDKIKTKCSVCGGLTSRVPYVLDCWFDSGSMPYAQWHYPFENEKLQKEQFPADFICEAIDQTRGWFYTLLAISTLYSGKSSYKTVLTTGHVLDEEGKKMSKSLGNVIDPFVALDKYGADVIRWNFYSGASLGNNFRAGFSNFDDVKRRFFLLLWNSYKFFTTFANMVDFKPNTTLQSSNKVLDRWILSRLNSVILETELHLDKYKAFEASSVIENFVTKDLSNWYIRRSRERVNPSLQDYKEVESCLSVIHHVLLTTVKLMAPFAPFLTEEMYQNLTLREGLDSVHLEDWPLFDKKSIDKSLEDQMKLAREIVEKAHSRRQDLVLKLRQPLSYVKVSGLSKRLPLEIEEVIIAEINVKKIEYELSSEEKEIKVDIDATLTKDLIQEGIARDIVRSIQEERKVAGFSFSDKVNAVYPRTDDNDEAVLRFMDEIVKRAGVIKLVPGDRYEVSKS